MAQAKRKDTKGRVLEKGESQRKDGTYMYRWTDASQKRQTVYAKTLNELREIELEVTRIEEISNLSWEKGKLKVRELVALYREIHKNAKLTTQQKYKYFDGLIEKINLGDVQIKDIKTSTAKSYMLLLSGMGYSYGSIQAFKSTLSPIFQMAVEDDYIIKNPFNFQLCNIIDDDRKERTAMTHEQERDYLEFVKNHGIFRHSYEDILILLRTGMRVSELYGLTFKDLDFKNRRIYVNKQLHYLEGKYVIMTTKSKAGVRTLAMDEEVRKAFMKKFAEPRPKVEFVVDGYSGFVFMNRQGRPKIRKNLQMTMREIKLKREKQGLTDFSEITPHVLRHTFCSRMIENGIDPKTLQILMGHSDIGTTLNIYTHVDPEVAAKSMETIMLARVANH
ncbi:MAG: site-specific integrase [Lachnospiraceae bacterium]|nr:site-specific integrase [Lachnospiraceae bacterium]